MRKRYAKVAEAFGFDLTFGFDPRQNTSAHVVNIISAFVRAHTVLRIRSTQYIVLRRARVLVACELLARNSLHGLTETVVFTLAC